MACPKHDPTNGHLVEGHNKKQQKVNNLNIDKVCDQNLQIFHEKLLLTRKEEIRFYKKKKFFFLGWHQSPCK